MFHTIVVGHPAGVVFTTTVTFFTTLVAAANGPVKIAAFVFQFMVTELVLPGANMVPTLSSMVQM